MSDYIDVPASPPPPPPPGSPPPSPSGDNPDRPSCAPAEIAEGKALAIISYALNYIGIPFFAVPLIMRGDRFSLYHAKQALVLWLFLVPGGCVFFTAAHLFTFCTCGLGAIIAYPVVIVALVLLWVINTMGLVNAVEGRCSPLWSVGPMGERWFAGIRVEPKAGNTP